MGFAAFLILAFLSYTNDAHSKTVTFVGIEYHNGTWPTTHTWLPTSNKAFSSDNFTPCGGQSRCTLTIPKNMSPPISVYYDIGPFYENYLDFVKTTDYAVNSFASRIAYRTFFNDTFEIQGV